jgi:hypothetical protein
MILALTIVMLHGARLTASNPQVCSAADFAGRGRFEAHMRAQRPGDSVYVPRPFPKDNAAILEDFGQQVQILLNGSTHPLIESGQRALRRAIDGGALHVGIVRESNWRNFRCKNYRGGETVYLLRLYDTTTATELARATMEESGLINGVIYPTDRRAPIWSKTLPTLPEGERLLTAAVGPVQNVEYATSYGSADCDEFMPCVVGRLAGGDGYALLSYSGIYTFDAGSRHVDRRLSARNQSLPSMMPNERLTSVGSTYDVVVKKVADRP